MGTPSLPESAVLFTGLLYQKAANLDSARDILKRPFGDIFLETPPLPWDWSDYYAEELGSAIVRVFLFFKNPFSQERIPEIKLITNGVEDQLSAGRRRNINIDPGYLTLSKVVLASTKNYAHRIYMGRGIYAETTLVFRDGRYQPHLFTYRDYASETYREIFARAREFLKAQ
jgi:Domain of unknown function (DUF4416)